MIKKTIIIFSFITLFPLLLIILFFGIEAESSKVSNSCTNSNYPELIEKQRKIVELKKGELSLELFTENLLLAQLWQESGAIKGVLESDPWQSSESLCGSIGCITDPVVSTDQAFKYHKTNIGIASDLGLENQRDAVLQAYNFGSGYLFYLSKFKLNHSESVAYNYSVKMTQKYPEYGRVCSLDEKGKACYGDFKYVSTIQQKMNETCEFSGVLTIVPLDEYIITQYFGKASNQLYQSGEHMGMDIAGVDGSPIRSPGEGKVIFAGYDSVGGYMVKIDHGDNIVSLLAHMKPLLQVKVGDVVTPGEVVGYQGSTGYSTGSHLHIEIREEEISVDPLKYLPQIKENASADFAQNGG